MAHPGPRTRLRSARPAALAEPRPAALPVMRRGTLSGWRDWEPASPGCRGSSEFEGVRASTRPNSVRVGTTSGFAIALAENRAAEAELACGSARKSRAEAATLQVGLGRRRLPDPGQCPLRRVGWPLQQWRLVGERPLRAEPPLRGDDGSRDVGHRNPVRRHPSLSLAGRHEALHAEPRASHDALPAALERDRRRGPPVNGRPRRSSLPTRSARLSVMRLPGQAWRSAFLSTRTPNALVARQQHDSTCHHLLCAIPSAASARWRGRRCLGSRRHPMAPRPASPDSIGFASSRRSRHRRCALPR